MRQWMVNPKIMCRKHLLGEHLEHHMFYEAIKNGRKVDGYVKNNLLEILSLKQRHDEVAEEMKRRGYRHNTPLEVDLQKINQYSEDIKNYKIDKDKSLQDLLLRCSKCRKRYDENK